MGCWLRCCCSGRTSPTPPCPALALGGGVPSRTPSHIHPAIGMLPPCPAVVSDASMGDAFPPGWFVTSRRGRMRERGVFWGQASPSPPSCGLHYMVLG